MKVERIEDATDIYLRGSICLSDVPKDMIYISPKNGKKYLSVIITKCDEMKWGKSHEVKTAPTQDDKARGVSPRGLGFLNEWKKDTVDTTQPKMKAPKKEKPKTEEIDELPF